MPKMAEYKDLAAGAETTGKRTGGRSASASGSETKEPPMFVLALRAPAMNGRKFGTVAGKTTAQRFGCRAPAATEKGGSRCNDGAASRDEERRGRMVNHDHNRRPVKPATALQNSASIERDRRADPRHRRFSR